MKKVALFIGEITTEYQHEIIHAMEEQCRKNRIWLVVLQNFAVFGTNVFPSLGERSIIYLADLQGFDGIVIAPDTFSVEGMYEDLAQKLNTLKDVPVISLRQETSDFYNVLVDDYPAMYGMVEHLICRHGKRKICFMKGLEHLKDARIRLQAYLDAMEHYGLEVSEHMTFNGYYWKVKGEEAVEWFFDGQDEKPDAVVCANDFMAISVVEALNKRGISVPEEVAVTGFDDREEARFAGTSMTTVHVESRSLVEKAVAMLKNIWQGNTQPKNEMIPGICLLRESCGCAKANLVDEQVRLFGEKEELIIAIGQANYMSVDQDNVNSYEEMFQVAANYIPENETIYVCFCDEQEKDVEKMEMAGKYTKEMILKSVLTRGHSKVVNERFPREQLLPKDYLKEGEPLIINTLHDRNELIGYIVVTPMIYEKLRFFYQLWVQCIAATVARLRLTRQSIEMRSMVDMLNRDELTGMYNRRELDRVLKKAHDRLVKEGECYFVVSIDMDGLKFINDHYGHLTGDEAIISMAQILGKVIKSPGMVARTGGDEFLVCYSQDDEEAVKGIINSLRAEMAAFNSNSGKPYELSASIGYARCLKGATPMNCIQAADDLMYKEKRNKKNARTD